MHRKSRREQSGCWIGCRIYWARAPIKLADFNATGRLVAKKGLSALGIVVTTTTMTIAKPLILPRVLFNSRAALALGSCLLVGGCALDPIGLALSAASTGSAPSDEAQTAEMADAYRAHDCAGLQDSLQSMLEGMQGPRSRGYRINAAAIQQVQREKNCRYGAVASLTSSQARQAPKETISATGAPTSTNALPATVSAPLSIRRMGIKADAVPDVLAAAMGVSRMQGVLVVSIEKGGSAERAGLQPLDVVLEAAGQPVSTASQLSAIAARMRDGYPLPLRIQRDAVVRESQVVLGSGPSP